MRCRERNQQRAFTDHGVFFHVRGLIPIRGVASAAWRRMVKNSHPCFYGLKTPRHAANPAAMPFQEIIHHDYIITVVHVPPQWQASIFPRRTDMPNLSSSERLVADSTFDGVVALAKSNIEKLMNSVPFI